MERHSKLGVVFAGFSLLLLAFPASVPYSPVNDDLGNTTGFGSYTLYLEAELTERPTTTEGPLGSPRFFRYENLSAKDQAIVDELIENGGYERSYAYEADPYPDRLPVGSHDHLVTYTVAVNDSYYRIESWSSAGSFQVDVPAAKQRLNRALAWFGGIVGIAALIYLTGISAPYSVGAALALSLLPVVTWLAVWGWPFRFLTAMLVEFALRIEAVGVALLGVSTAWKLIRRPPDADEPDDADADRERPANPAADQHTRADTDVEDS